MMPIGTEFLVFKRHTYSSQEPEWLGYEAVNALDATSAAQQVAEKEDDDALDSVLYIVVPTSEITRFAVEQRTTFVPRQIP